MRHTMQQWISVLASDPLYGALFHKLLVSQLYFLVAHFALLYRFWHTFLFFIPRFRKRITRLVRCFPRASPRHKKYAAVLSLQGVISIETRMECLIEQRNQMADRLKRYKKSWNASTAKLKVISKK